MDDQQSLSDLLSLLACESKREVKRLTKSMTLTSSAFDHLIVNAGSLGYVHQFCLRDMVPEHLTSGLTSLPDSNPAKLAKRLPQIFRDRRRLVGHLFHSMDGTVWHLIYFDQRDMGNAVEANWEHGPHIHYLSHLWPEHSMDSIVEEFNREKPRLNGAEHIRYLDDDRIGI